MNKQFAVFFPRRDNEIHRGPYETREDAQRWIDEAESDGFRPGVFVVREREVGEWK